jgi:hypothetical protein
VTPKPPSAIAILVLAAFAASAAPGCMSVGLELERRKPSLYGDVVIHGAFGLVGDAVLSLGAAAVHAKADEDPESGVLDMFPYYAAPLFILDAIVFVMIAQKMKK